MNGHFTIPEKTILAMHERFSPGREMSRKEIIDAVCARFPGTNRGSVIPSDYCDNIYNKAPDSGRVHIFHYEARDRYTLLPRPKN